MLDRIIFFELRHYGDLHITRNFVRYVINQIPAKEYVYVLTSDSKVFMDFPELKFEKYEEHRYPFTVYSPWMKIDNDLYINTSCGTNFMSFFQGTTIQTAHAIFKYYLKEFCSHSLPDDLRMFIPEIHFNKYKTLPVDIFMSNYREKKILIVNGECQSGQASNFDMCQFINTLAYKYQDYIFFVANQCFENSSDNIYFCKSILNLNENDIVETAYFSTFCDVIIGRASGVYSLSIEKQNIINHPKKFICISHTERDKDLGTSRIIPEMAKNFIWSNNYEFDSMLNVIEKII